VYRAEGIVAASGALACVIGRPSVTGTYVMHACDARVCTCYRPRQPCPCPWLPSWRRWAPGPLGVLPAACEMWVVSLILLDGPPIKQKQHRVGPIRVPARMVSVSYPRFSGTDRVLVIPYPTRIRGSIFG
jgi:hypothetical protein